MPVSPHLRLGSFHIFSLEVGPCCSVLNSIWLHRLYLSFLRIQCDSLLCIFTVLCNSSEGTLSPDLQCGIIRLPGFLAQHEVSHWLFCHGRERWRSWELKPCFWTAVSWNEVALDVSCITVVRLFFCIPWKSWHFPLTNRNKTIPKKGTFLLTFISCPLHFQPLVFFLIAVDLVFFLGVHSKMIKANIHSCFLWNALLTFLSFSLFEIYFLVLYLTFFRWSSFVHWVGPILLSAGIKAGAASFILCPLPGRLVSLKQV